MAAADLGFEATELRLGLPGGDGGEQARKRGFAETIDLKLKLEPAGEEEPAAAEEEVEVKAEVPESEEEKAADGGKMKRSPSQSSVVTAAAAAMADPAEKPRAPKAQVVGWPPVRSYRKSCFQQQSKSKPAAEAPAPEKKKEAAEAPPPVAGSGSLYVKVSMDGAPYLRKIDLKMYKGYRELREALEAMFLSCFSSGSGDAAAVNPADFAVTYEDKDGDLMLVGDVPFQMFMSTCKRLRIMKGSEARGLGSSSKE